tara:strand:+ start:474 stop:719 length:246 start_codon:yes stop_codon:yes gene_type:complete
MKLNSADRLKRLVENHVKEFLANDPNEEEIEKFYINRILPFDKRSVDEIIKETWRPEDWNNYFKSIRKNLIISKIPNEGAE